MTLERECVPIGHAPRICALHAALDYKWELPYAFQGEAHDYYEAVYVDRGEATVTEEAQVYRMRAGHFLLHKPMEFHRIHTDGHTHVLVLPFAAEGTYPDALTEGVIAVPPEMREAYMHLFARARSYFYAHNAGLPDGCGDTAEPAPVDDEALDERFGTEAALELSAWLTKLSRTAGEGAQDGIPDVQDEIPGGAENYRSAVSRMRNAIDTPVTMEAFAKEEHISLSRLKQIFYRYAGVSPKQYFTRLRVNACKELLLSGLSAKEVAEKMHFSSPAYFSLFFKNETGLSPSAYRK